MVENILIVEDEFIIAFDTKLMLESMDYNVVNIVSSGIDALKTVNTNKIDLILMDMILEGEMSGIDTAMEIRDKNFDIPIIYSTSYPQELTNDKIKETEPYDYLLKPFDHIKLQNAINNSLNH